MAHREPRAWEMCAKSLMTGVHTWKFEAKKEDGVDVVTSVSCLHCTLPAPDDVSTRLASDFETQKRRDRIAAELREKHKDATGLGKRKFA